MLPGGSRPALRRHGPSDSGCHWRPRRKGGQKHFARCWTTVPSPSLPLRPGRVAAATARFAESARSAPGPNAPFSTRPDPLPGPTIPVQRRSGAAEWRCAFAWPIPAQPPGSVNPCPRQTGVGRRSAGAVMSKGSPPCEPEPGPTLRDRVEPPFPGSLARRPGRLRRPAPDIC